MGHICQICFFEVVEHRIRKHLRMKAPLKKGQKVLLLTDSSKESVVAEYVLDSITAQMPVTEVVKAKLGDELNVIGFAHIFWPVDANDLAHGFLKGIFSGKQFEEKESVVGCLLDSEVKLYADLRELQYEERTEDVFTKKMEELEGYYPGSTFGLVKSKDQLE